LTLLFSLKTFLKTKEGHGLKKFSAFAPNCRPIQIKKIPDQIAKISGLNQLRTTHLSESG